MVFSFQGQAIWADLAIVILYCSCDDVLSGGYDVQFRYLALPLECRLDLHICRRGLPAMRRTMACFGDSIQLVCIGDDLKSEATGDTMLTVWKLHELSLATLWGLEGFKEAGLPEILPIHPILSTQQDGVLYMLFLDEYHPPDKQDAETEDEEEEEEEVEETTRHCLFGLDICNKRILSSRRLPAIPYVYRPNLLGFDFFKCLDKHCLSPLAAQSTDEAAVHPFSASRKRKCPDSPSSA
uniref:DUF1618 domain-containing protein n=1 Tax=Leersia perrieri TaxID=77586 RepID=A0A0D9W7U7_9ORYZ